MRSRKKKRRGHTDTAILLHLQKNKRICHLGFWGTTFGGEHARGIRWSLRLWNSGASRGKSL